MQLGFGAYVAGYNHTPSTVSYHVNVFELFLKQFV